MAEERNLELDNEVLRRTISQLQSEYGVMATERAELAVRNGMIADNYNQLHVEFEQLKQNFEDFKSKLTPANEVTEADSQGLVPPVPAEETEETAKEV